MNGKVLFYTYQYQVNDLKILVLHCIMTRIFQLSAPPRAVLFRCFHRESWRVIADEVYTKRTFCWLLFLRPMVSDESEMCSSCDEDSNDDGDKLFCFAVILSFS